MTAPRIPLKPRKSDWPMRWAFFIAGIAFAAVWVAV